MSASQQPENEYGPLGPGHTPEKDPMKGIVGVFAGAMCMEAITFYLVLTVIARVDGGAYWTTFNWVFVTALATVMFVWAFFQRSRFAIPVDIALQVIALVGFVVHPAMGIVALCFIAVWGYIFYLRSALIARMKRGLLTTQHM